MNRSATMPGLQRLDLVRQHWESYAFVGLGAVLIHIAWLVVFNIQSLDGLSDHVQTPAARERLAR